MGNENVVTDCPNCWGYQEYQGESFDIITKVKKCKGWIMAYVNKYFYPIQ